MCRVVQWRVLKWVTGSLVSVNGILENSLELSLLPGEVIPAPLDYPFISEKRTICDTVGMCLRSVFLYVWAAWQSLYISLLCMCEYRSLMLFSHLHHHVSPCEGLVSVLLPLLHSHSLKGRIRSDPSIPSCLLHSDQSLSLFYSILFFDSWLSRVWLADIFWTLGWDRASLMSHVNVLCCKDMEKTAPPTLNNNKWLNWTFFHAL